MVETNPLDELNDLQGDDSDPEQLRSCTQREELGSDPSDSEGASTQPKEDTCQRTTNPVGLEAWKAWEAKHKPTTGDASTQYTPREWSFEAFVLRCGLSD
jgi:hypothetical protein